MAHFKKNMRILLVFLLICFFSKNAFGQETDLEKIVIIDSLISVIPENPSKDSSFKIIQSSGLIWKRSLLFFKKQIGGFHEIVIYKEGNIYLVKIIEKIKNTSTVQNYYFNHNQLIRYNERRERLEKKELIIDNEISAYFDSDRPIVITGNENLIVDEILEFSEERKSSWKAFILDRY